MPYAMISLPDGRPFLAKPDQIGSSDTEMLAIAKREAPVERAQQIEGLMLRLACYLQNMDAESDARH